MTTAEPTVAEPYGHGPVPTDAVDFHFDPMCPYAYQSALWMREVRDHCGVTVTWRFASLEEFNREPHQPHPWERDWAWGFSAMRVAALLRRDDPALLERWYVGWGAALHERGEQPFTREGAAALVRSLDLPADCVDAALSDPTTTDEVRADHDRIVERFGAFGVPTIVFDDRFALFGPVVVPAPKGDDAVRLWELVTGWLAFPNLYEIQQPKNAAALGHIGTAFAPYLGARAWQSKAKPTP